MLTAVIIQSLFIALLFILRGTDKLDVIVKSEPVYIFLDEKKKAIKKRKKK